MLLDLTPLDIGELTCKEWDEVARSEYYFNRYTRRLGCWEKYPKEDRFCVRISGHVGPHLCRTEEDLENFPQLIWNGETSE